MTHRVMPVTTMFRCKDESLYELRLEGDEFDAQNY